jgi:hypothetical protein
MAKKLETGLKTEIYRAKSSWSDKIEAVRRMGGFSGTRQPSIQSQGGRAGVLAMRKNVR